MSETKTVGIIVFYEVTSYKDDMDKAYKALIHEMKTHPPLDFFSSGGYSFKYKGSQDHLRIFPTLKPEKVYIHVKEG